LPNAQAAARLGRFLNDDTLLAEMRREVHRRGSITEVIMKIFFGVLLLLAFTSAASAQDSPYRKELKRADLTGTNMEVITSISEIKPGEASTLHIHHGEESYYFLEGGTVEGPDGKQVSIPTGAMGINVRDVPHGAFKVVGDKPVKLLTVHIVDKGKPLYDTPK
jgi:mannose-6-phosphate isomerase-like protein (cupin superfamily)